MKFYDCAPAPSPRRVRVYLAEKGIELPTVQIDLGAGEQLGADYRAVNPDCTVPALVLDDGTVLSESFAICQYLESVYPEPPLMGRNELERALVTMWNAKIENQGFGAIAECYRNYAQRLAGRALTGAEDFEQIPALVARGRRRAELFFDRLERQLDGREFVVGDAYTVADITALIAVDFAARIKLAPPAEAGNLRRWHAAVSARPSAQH